MQYIYPSYTRCDICQRPSQGGGSLATRQNVVVGGAAAGDTPCNEESLSRSHPPPALVGSVVFYLFCGWMGWGRQAVDGGLISAELGVIER